MKEEEAKQTSNQCDQIGRNFAIWAIFFGIGRIFFWKISPK
jgi:ribosomal protein S14